MINDASDKKVSVQLTKKGTHKILALDLIFI